MTALMKPAFAKLGALREEAQVCLRKSGKQETELGSDTVKGPFLVAACSEYVQ